MQVHSTKQVVIDNIDAKSFYEELNNIKLYINDLMKPPQIQKVEGKEYITREEVAKIFDVSVVTISSWSNKGILTSYGIGNRVRYVKQEVLNAPIPINRRR